MHLRRALCMSPDRRVFTRTVATITAPNCKQTISLKATHTIDFVGVSHGRRNDIAGQACAFPNHFAGCRVVAADLSSGSGDDLRFSAVIKHEGSGPGSALFA